MTEKNLLLEENELISLAKKVGTPFNIYDGDEIEKNARFRVKGLYRVMIKFICPICMLLILFSALFLKL